MVAGGEWWRVVVNGAYNTSIATQIDIVSNTNISHIVRNILRRRNAPLARAPASPPRSALMRRRFAAGVDAAALPTCLVKFKSFVEKT